EETLRRHVVTRFELILFFRRLPFERNGNLMAAALLRPRAIALVREEVTNRDRQERPKAAPLGIGRAEVILLEDPCEEFLGQIAGFIGVISLPPDEAVDRRPV